MARLFTCQLHPSAQEHTLSKPLSEDEELYFALTFPFPLGTLASVQVLSSLASCVLATVSLKSSYNLFLFTLFHVAASS